MTEQQNVILEFEPNLNEFFASRVQKPYTVLSGGNNSGKTLLLKWLKATVGRPAYMIGTNRFYHVYHFSSSLRDPNELENLENQFRQTYWPCQYNHEQNFIDLNSVIISLSNAKRNLLFSLCGDLLGNQFSLKKVDEENDLSVSYIDMDGQNLAVGSTGTRLLMTILGICMDERFSSMLIDEPELGLSPRVQQAFASFLQDAALRARYFPHLERVFLATHSHVFLSRNEIRDNFIVSKLGKKIMLHQVETVNEFHRLQFNLLGNTFETLSFPSAIVVVEGKTDHAFLERVLQLRFSTKRVNVISSGGDVKRKVHGLREAFGDLNRSPFRNRLFVVLDQVHQPGLVAELQNLGVEATNIVTWSKNGIEYIYPPTILSEIFACSPDRVNDLSIRGDIIELNGLRKTKNELKDEVIKWLDSNTVLPAELEKKLLTSIATAIA